MSSRSESPWTLQVICTAALLRATGVALTGVLLGVYLSREGFSIAQTGMVIAAGLASGAAATAFVGMYADRLGRRRILVALSLLATLGGAGLAIANHFSAILALAIVGMISGTGTDRGPAFALEQAVIPATTSAERRTVALSWHSVMMDIGHAAGALLAALPLLLAKWTGIEILSAYRVTFGLYAAVNFLSALVYLLPSVHIEAPSRAPERNSARNLSPASRLVVTRLAGLFALDSFGGGFLTDALMAYWFFRRFGISEGTLGLLFFAGNILNSGSYFVAAKLARRIGLLNTMVFTHIPSSLLLMVVPLARSRPWAIAFYLAWESLVEMDVPTRQSYVVAVVEPEERTFSTSVTNLARNVARSISPSLAGYFMQRLGLAAPLFFGGSIKIAYDLLLFRAFRHLKPPEEKQTGILGAPANAGDTQTGLD